MRKLSLTVFCTLFCCGFVLSAAFGQEQPKAAVVDPATHPDHQQYLDFFAKVYDTMDKNYYYPVSDQRYQAFLKNFDKKIYSQLKSSGKSVDFIKWRSAAYMVEALKDEEDIFSAFMPPKPAKKYEKEALGKKIDLGIEGLLKSEGFLITKIEPRSDAYEQGLRENDLLLSIDSQNVLSLTAEKIMDLLTPLENAKVKLSYLDFEKHLPHEITATSKEYFKQAVFMVPVDVPGVSCLKIEHFNRMTGEDMGRFLAYIEKKGDQNLIIDLRGNPGGPPLAAREIAAYFLKPEEDFAYFKWKNKPNATLDVPKIPEKYRYAGKIVILVNEKSGSASELFTGVMQFRGRAAVMGQNTAGQVFLKSMFNFDDESMLLLVTARGHRPDGSIFSFKGLTPDMLKPDTDGLIHEAALYLVNGV